MSMFLTFLFHNLLVYVQDSNFFLFVVVCFLLNLCADFGFICVGFSLLISYGNQVYVTEQVVKIVNQFKWVNKVESEYFAPA